MNRLSRKHRHQLRMSDPWIFLFFKNESVLEKEVSIQSDTNGTNYSRNTQILGTSVAFIGAIVILLSEL